MISPFFMSFYGLAAGVVGISLAHSLMPQHWLPFILVGRRQGWTFNQTMGYLCAGAVVHMFSTIFVGLAVGYLGYQIDERFDAYHGIVPGLVLCAFGAGFFISSFGHRHSGHCHHHLRDKVAPSSLILMMGLSPCLVVAPFFVLMGPLGLGAALKASVAMACLSILGMMGLGWLALKGLDMLKLEWLERNESRVMGSLLIAMGLVAILV
jgi:nickel/cobalt transporter (NicO) family protein